MGNLSKKNKKKEKLKLSLANPFFKDKTLITNEYFNFNYGFSYDSGKNQCLDIYKLNDINNAFYIAFQKDFSNTIEIIKYLFDIKSLKNVAEVFILKTPIKRIKYFFDELQKCEYLFVVTEKQINIFLILNEEKYDNIYTYEEKSWMEFDIIKDFEIIYNKYNKINYILVSFSYSGHYTINENKLSFIKFEKKNCSKITEVSLGYGDYDIFKIWDDTNSKKFFLIYISNSNIDFLDIETSKYAYKKSIKIKISDIDCINADVNDNYLYLLSEDNYLIIIDLFKNQIINKIKINDNIKIKSLLNWDDTYIIIEDRKNFYIFDKTINKIINKYSVAHNSNGNIISLNKFYFHKYNYSFLFIDFNDNTIIFFKNDIN